MARRFAAMVALEWESLAQVFTAQTIMTPRDELLMWEEGTDLSLVCAEAKRRRFDVIPACKEGRITGVLTRDAHQPRPLTRRWLVSSDTPIPELVSSFVESGKPALLVLHGQDAVGLVTPADLNKMPARVYFYNLVGELELGLAGLIRARWTGDSKDHLQLLTRKRREKLTRQRDRLARGNTDIDIIHLFHLSDLISVVTESDHLTSVLGFASRGEAQGHLGGLVDFRRRTMHPVRPVLDTLPRDLHKLNARLSRARDLLVRLSEADVAPARPAPLKRSQTVTAKRFYYEGSLSDGLVVYPTDEQTTEPTGTKVRIRSDVVEFIRRQISEAGVIAMGASFDNPPPGSLGYRLREAGKPPVLSYVIPLLIEEGFCTAVEEGRGYVIRHAATQSS